jgi:hypothetical protein
MLNRARIEAIDRRFAASLRSAVMAFVQVARAEIAAGGEVSWRAKRAARRR